MTPSRPVSPSVARPVARPGEDDVLDVVRRLHDTDLRPGPEVDHLFGRLVALAMALPADDPLLDEADVVDDVRRLCAAGETELERHWARQIMADPARVAGFPYRANYRALARAELRALHGAVRQARSAPLQHLVFAGSGPLPLTAVEVLRRRPDLTITCLDIDAAAADLGSGVLRALVPGHRVEVLQADAHDHDYSGSDVVLVAALVGGNPAEKSRLLDGIAGKVGPDVVLAARSVPDDGRRLLYPRLPPAALGDGLRVQGEWFPPSGVVNSLVIAQPA